MLDLDWLRVHLECDEDTVRSLLELYTTRGTELIAASGHPTLAASASGSYAKLEPSQRSTSATVMPLRAA